MKISSNLSIDVAELKCQQIYFQILQHCMLCVGANTANYLSSGYLVMKCAFFINVVMQFVLLTGFLEFNYWEYGPRAVQVFSPKIVIRHSLPENIIQGVSIH